VSKLGAGAQALNDRPPGNRQPGPGSTYLVSLRVEVRASGKPFDFVFPLIGGTYVLAAYLSMLSIQLTATAVELGAVALVPHGRPVRDLLRALGPPTRCLAMSATNTLPSYDQLGLRFWADSTTTLVGGLQLGLETQPRCLANAPPLRAGSATRGTRSPCPCQPVGAGQVAGLPAQ
jgi:hypothetical protein